MIKLKTNTQQNYQVFRYLYGFAYITYEDYLYTCNSISY